MIITMRQHCITIHAFCYNDLGVVEDHGERLQGARQVGRKGLGRPRISLYIYIYIYMYICIACMYVQINK